MGTEDRIYATFGMMSIVMDLTLFFQFLWIHQVALLVILYQIYSEVYSWADDQGRGLYMFTCQYFTWGVCVCVGVGVCVCV